MTRRIVWVVLLAAVTSCEGTDRPAPAPLLAGMVVDSLHTTVSGLMTDGRMAFLARSAPDFSRTDLRVTRWNGQAWLPDESLFPALTGHVAGGATSPGDSLLYLWTTSASAFGPAWDIAVSRHSGEWEPPVMLAPPVNSDSMECCVAARQPGWLYFASNRLGTWDIFRAARGDDGWEEPERLPDGINSAGHEWPGSVDPQGRFLLFSSIRPGGAGADDIYLACARNGRWDEPHRLGDSVNTPAFEDSPLLSPGGRHLLFARHGGGPGLIGRVHVIDAAPILERCGITVS